MSGQSHPLSSPWLSTHLFSPSHSQSHHPVWRTPPERDPRRSTARLLRHRQLSLYVHTVNLERICTALTEQRYRFQGQRDRRDDGREDPRFVGAPHSPHELRELIPTRADYFKRIGLPEDEAVRLHHVRTALLPHPLPIAHPSAASITIRSTGSPSEDSFSIIRWIHWVRQSVCMDRRS